jgi:hypothetical protein
VFQGIGSSMSRHIMLTQLLPPDVDDTRDDEGDDVGDNVG